MTIREAILANPAATDAQVRALVQNKATEQPVSRQRLSELAFSAGTVARLRAVVAAAGSTTTQKTNAQNVLDLITFGPDSLPTNTEGSLAFSILAAGLTQAEANAVVTLGGGMKYAALTDAGVAAERAAMGAEAAQQTRANAIAADDAEVTAAWNQWSAARDVYVTSGGARPAKPFGGA